LKRGAVAIALTCATLAAGAGLAQAEGGELHKPLQRGTAGFRESFVLRINAGPAPEYMGDAIPSRTDATRHDGAFVGPDGRLYVWDAEHRNVKVAAFAYGVPPKVTVTPEWPEGLAIANGDADSLGCIYLASVAGGGEGPMFRCLAWRPGASAWEQLPMPRYGGIADVGSLGLREHPRVRALADGRAVLVPATATNAGRGLVIGAHGHFAPLDSVVVVEAPELARAIADRHGRRLADAGVHAIVLADSAGAPVATMARAPMVSWKPLATDAELLEPWGTLLVLHETTRGLTVHRLTPQIDGAGMPKPVAPAPPVANGDTTRLAGAATTDSAKTAGAKAKKKALKRRTSRSSLTD
jgi:hypothetical protein